MLSHPNMVERKVLSEIIHLYRDSPCLWDLTCEAYKDKNQKRIGWESLVAKWKEVEPDTNVISIKKRIDNLKSSYKREAKKVKESKQRANNENEVYKPNLWYFDMMTFLENEIQQPRDFETYSNESLQGDGTGKKRRLSQIDKNASYVKETLHDSLIDTSKKTNTFAIYVGEQLENLSVYQQQIAEKLISDVLFLAKTDNLNFNSHVESYYKQRSTFTNNYSPRLASPQDNSNPSENHSSYQYNTPSPQTISLTQPPQVTVKSEPSPQNSPPEHDSSLFLSSFQQNVLSVLPENVISITCQSPKATESLVLSHFQTNLSTSTSHIQVKPTTSPSLPQFQVTEIKSQAYRSQQHEDSSVLPTRSQNSTPSPKLCNNTERVEEITENLDTEVPSGSLLKELLILKNEEK